MKSYTIKITNPCSNKWEEMDAVQQGKFCQQCNKNVIDFTQKSEQQIKDYFIANNNQPTCGRFYNHQIDNIVIELEASILQSNISYWQKLLVIILVCFGNQLFAIEFKLNQTENPDSLVINKIDTIQSKDSLSFQENNDAIAKTDTSNTESLRINNDDLFITSEIELNTAQFEYITTGFTTLEALGIEPFIPSIFIPSNPNEPKPNNLISLSTNYHNNDNKKQKENDDESQNSMVMLAPSSIVVKKTRRKNSNKKPD